MSGAFLGQVEIKSGQKMTAEMGTKKKTGNSSKKNTRDEIVQQGQSRRGSVWSRFEKILIFLPELARMSFSPRSVRRDA
jgi:hypothetical protein